MEEFVMEFLNINPLIKSLRNRPSDFEWERDWLRHLPSDHRFKVDQDGNVWIDAQCDCAILRVRREQGKEFWNALEIWEATYWRPLKINKEFARHFRSPTWWQWPYRTWRAILHRAIATISQQSHSCRSS